MAEDNYVYQVIAAFLSRSLLSFRSTPSFNHHPSSFSVLPPNTVQPGHPISHQDVHPLPASFLERRGLAGLSFPRELLELPVPPCTGLLAVSCPPGQDYPFRESTLSILLMAGIGHQESLRSLDGRVSTIERVYALLMAGIDHRESLHSLDGRHRSSREYILLS
ncbi:hypothetical protein PCANC_28582 [Puccinia coronata f. sp. avenae]|uniref:Uncharacterized protein n=1 Tax=Puccinia coronata f. sp. avenae TaxID=200324 RepID=A0A2N5TAL9_9BASI|nr:hypothetical protein PCANC_28582 [Puccinia coronata f. sp. avenae]